MAAVSPGNQLTEDDKQEIRDMLAKKINKVRLLFKIFTKGVFNHLKLSV